MKYAKLILFLSAAVTVAMLICGCGGLPEDEAADVVRELITASYELNEIYFGDGLPAIADSDEGYAGIYSDVTDDAVYKTEAELRDATLAVFSENYSGVLFETFLTGYSDGEGGAVFARYIEDGERLTKRTKYDQLVDSVRTYDLDNITIKRSTGKKIVAVLQSYIDGKADAEVTVTICLEQRKSDDGTVSLWRLDSPTY